MSGLLSGALRLSPDAVVVPVAALDHAQQRALRARPGDVAVGHRRDRRGSMLVDAATAETVRLFAEPRSVVDVVLRHVARHGGTPEQVLDQLAPLLARLVERQVLVPLGDDDAAEPVATGTRIGPWTVDRAVQLTTDGQVLRASGPAGEVALKLAAAGAGPAAALDHEMRALTRAAEHPTARRVVAGPPLTGDWQGRRWLACPWVPGVTLDEAGADARARGRGAVLDLLRAVAGAYAALHAAGVVHGDVHPRNVIVGPAGVRLVDLGRAALTPPDAHETGGPLSGATHGGDPHGGVPRGGVPDYYEPELAVAMLHRTDLPRATPVGEQYAVGAVLYEVATGRRYADLGTDRAGLLQDVLALPPREFASWGLPPWPDLERVLAVALAKHPAERFRALTALVRALDGVPATSGSVQRAAPPGDLGELVERTRDRYAVDGPVWRGDLPAPSATWAFGAAGIAWFWLRQATSATSQDAAAQSARDLAAADAWSERAVLEAAAPRGLTAPALDIGPRTVGEGSLLYGAPGTWLVRALTAGAWGDATTARDAARRAVDLWDARSPASSEPVDVRPLTTDAVIGSASGLLGLAVLAESLDVSVVGPDVVAAVHDAGDALADRLTAALGLPTPPPHYLGLAHGRAGHLHALLRWGQARHRPLDPGVLGALGDLAELATTDGRGGLAWPRHAPGPYSDGGAWPGWCHGSAGHALLWSLVHRVTGDPSALTIAEAAVGHALATAGSASASLCCGAGGIAYAALEVHRLTGAHRYLEAAWDRGLAAARAADVAPMVPGSLMKGDLGIALLAGDLLAPDLGGFPLFVA